MPIQFKAKSKALKVTKTTDEADEAAKEAAEEAARVEAERLEAERQKSQRKKEIWNTRPGPVPIGWSCAIDHASGFEFYWRQDDPIGTRTWERPACCGETPPDEEVAALVQSLRDKPRVPCGSEWQLTLQRLWGEEPVDPICNLQRPGSKQPENLVQALTLLRFFFKGAIPLKVTAYQDLLTKERHKTHEKLPPHFHNVCVIDQIVDLLGHDDGDVQYAAACALAMCCMKGHRGCQDQVAMTGKALTLLVRMLDDRALTQVALLAIGRVCEGSHKGNQNQLAMVENGASIILDLLEYEDEDIQKTAQYCVYWASAHSMNSTRVYWERSRGHCMSLMAPIQPMQHCDRGKVTTGELTPNWDHRTESKRRASYLTTGDSQMKAIANGEYDVADENEVPYNDRNKAALKESKKNHPRVSEKQDPNHSHLKLVSKRASQRVAVELIQEHADDPKFTAPMIQLNSQMLALPGQHQQQLALPGQPEHPEHPEQETAQKERKERRKAELQTWQVKALRKETTRLRIDEDRVRKAIFDDDWLTKGGLIELILEAEARAAASHPSAQELTLAIPQNWEDLKEDPHDLHQLDPALDDRQLCRIGLELRHAAPTGFLHPTTDAKRYGMVT